jgi:hemophore-related protein
MTFASLARRTAASVLGAGGVLLGVAAPAVAYDGPGCTAADITAVEAQVATAMTGYLFTHPDVNAFFTSLDGLNRSDSQSKAQAYLAANPQIKAEIDAIRGPGSALRDRCNIPDDHIHFGVV